jgi:CheY-like chemotaxis protein
MVGSSPLDLNAVVESTVASFKRQPLAEKVGLDVELGQKLPWLLADRKALEHVLRSLLENACEALPNGGRVRVRTYATTLTSIDLATRPEAAAGRHVVMEVLDTGLGMDGTTLTRIFEPFFTTKEIGNGSGLGLSSSYGIVRELEGWIEVQSELGKGSSFQVYLPAPAGGRSMEPAVQSSSNARPVRILLVDDEPALLKLGKRAFVGAGYEVVTASTGPEAVSLWERHRPAIDLLVTDMAMPGGMNGQEVVRKIRAEAPNLPVVLASGYNVDDDPELFSAPRTRFLAKPYEPRHLLELIEDLLDERAAGAV